jgi:hypothetical protein
MIRPISAPRAKRKPTPIETSPFSSRVRAGFFSSAIDASGWGVSVSSFVPARLEPTHGKAKDYRCNADNQTRHESVPPSRLKADEYQAKQSE